jgi:alpha-N-arabinofuranosidase
MHGRTHLAALLLAFSSVSALSQNQQPTIISVDATHPGAAISPSEFGIFFEDINFGADGGLYPELVKNRSFEFSEPGYDGHNNHGRRLSCERRHLRHA